MTTFMAYDREALLTARRSAILALDEVTALVAHTSDLLAHDLTVHLSWLRTALEQVWIPTITRVLAVDLLTPFTSQLVTSQSVTSQWVRSNVPTGLDDWENALPWVMAHLGWHVRPETGRSRVDDPMTPAMARALAVRIAHDDPTRWTATDWSSLGTLLRRIAADAELTRHFRANIHRWTPTLNALGVARVFSTVDPADALVIGASLGAILLSAARASCPDPRAALPDVEHLLPSARALLLPYLGLEPDLLAGAAATLLHDHPSTASILLPILTTMREVMPRTMVLMADDVSLLYRAVDREVVDAALVASVDPRAATPEQAEHVITRVGGWLAAEGLHPETLGRLLAPWLLAFSPLSTRFRTSPIELARLLEVAMNDPRSAERLATVAEHLDTAHLSEETLDEAAALVGLVRQFALDVAVAHTADSEAAWDTLWAIAAIGAAVAGLAPGSGVAVTGLSLIVAHWWAPNAGDSQRAGTAAMDQTLTAMAATALAEIVVRWRDDGLVVDPPPTADHTADDHDPAPSVRFLREFADWQSRLPGGYDGPLATRAARIVYSLVSPASVGEHLAEAI